FPVQLLATMIMTMLAAFHNHIHGATLLIVPALAMVGRGTCPRGFAALFATGIVAPSYLFCVTGTSQHVAWLLIGLMVIGLGLCLARGSQLARPEREVDRAGTGPRDVEDGPPPARQRRRRIGLVT